MKNVIDSYTEANFYGNKTLSIQFKNPVTIITGANGTGKTRLINKLWNATDDHNVFKLSLDDLFDSYYDYQNLTGYYFSEEDGKKLEKMMNKLVGDCDIHYEFVEPNMVIWRGDETIQADQLSSGLKVLTRLIFEIVYNRPELILLDCIDQLLHISIQEKLISAIRKLAPNSQLIMTTHCPSVLLEGWDSYTTYILDNLK